MFESIYASLTGLWTFAKGLNNISNNVSNLNTPGFKRSQVLFEDLLYNRQNLGDSGPGNQGPSLGNGVDIGGTTIIFKQGELRQTGNDQDAAIDGNGFFILRKDGKTSYTRSGQFEFDQDGFLISSVTKARVAVLGSNNQLEDFNILASNTNPPKATSIVKFDGNLSSNDADNLHVVSNITVYSSDGQATTLKITFTNNSAVTPRSWLFTIEDQAGNNIANNEIQFQGDGSPASGFETYSFAYTPPGGNAQTIQFDFGLPGKFSGITNFSAGTDSTVKTLSTDGYSLGSLTKVSYDSEGRITLTYSNGQTAQKNQLALAWFTFLAGLKQDGSNLFVNEGDQEPIIGSAKTSVFGKITSGSIESSNVDLTQQFSELIVTQRGYQASSQVISATNEMIQQLLDLKGKR